MSNKNKIIDFQSAKEEKEQDEFIQNGIKMFTNDLLPFMTQNDFAILQDLFERDASNDEWAHELAKIKTRIDLENGYLR